MSDEEPVLRQGFVLPVRAGRDGGPSRKQARGPRWRRTSHGFYVPSSVSSDDVDQRIVEASVLVPPRHAVTGWAALRWQGGRWFGGLSPSGRRLPITICVGTHDIRRQPGIEVSGEGPSSALVRLVDGVPVMDARAAVSFEMRYAASVRLALVELEKAVDDDLVSIAEMEEFLATQNGWTGIPRARDAMPWAQENSWSPQEVHLRWVWEVEAGLPRPRCNAPVFLLSGTHVATPDLLDPETGVFGEYDGEVHLDRETRDRDLRREAALRDLGLEGAVMTAADRIDPSRFVTRLRSAYARARRRPAAGRGWTVEPPAWWTPTETVAQRRALTVEQRRRFLRHRSA
ncbi:MAG: hypothetical protein JWN84_4072 [Nocardioides sp.]|nr:hypothetical protein [Nocardioides sp.]